MQGDAADINTPADGTVTEAKLASTTGATGGAGNHVFFLNEQNVDTDFTIPTNRNAMSVDQLQLIQELRLPSRPHLHGW